MRHFLKIAEGLDMTPVLNALAVRPDLWNENTIRTAHPQSPHVECDDIWLMFNEVRENIADTIDDVQTRPYRAWLELPCVRMLVLDLMRRVEATQVGRVLITRLKPGGKIAPHRDEGRPTLFYNRYQVAVQSLPGCNFTVGDDPDRREVVQFHSGDVWWFNNRETHEVVNNSADDRIALICDFRSC